MPKFKFAIILCLLLFVVLVSCPKPSIPPKPIIPPGAKLVSLFFDDGWQNQYDVALPILLMHDFKATFAVITDYIGTGWGPWKYMGIKELKELAKYGMDIASHTKTHVDLTKNLTEAQLREEIIESKKYLEGLGFKIRTFVYPYNEWNDTVVNYVIKAGYLCARSGWPEQAFHFKSADPRARYHVNSYCIRDQNLDEFEKILANTKPDHVVVLVYHHISDEVKEWATPVRNFAKQMRYLKENGFTVVLLPDLFQ